MSIVAHFSLYCRLLELRDLGFSGARRIVLWSDLGTSHRLATCSVLKTPGSDRVHCQHSFMHETLALRRRCCTTPLRHIQALARASALVAAKPAAHDSAATSWAIFGFLSLSPFRLSAHIDRP